MTVTYGARFYTEQGDPSKSSAEIVVPIIFQALRPKSMVDVGCGLASWPSVFAKHGAEVAHGVDGPWVDRNAIYVPQHSFFEFDFEKAEPPFKLPLPRERYDLVTSFEFIEHVDAKFAGPLVDMFCSLADVLVIGGAIPFQGGLHHVNEQWPHYWTEKFEARGYEVCDFIRPLVWNSGVEPWYAQNTLAYFKGGAPAAVKKLAARAWGDAVSKGLPLVHPALWESKSLNSMCRPEPFVDRLSRMPRRIAGRVKRALIG